jgi:manganese-dependent ADP-ribose/CDP-alcohol diphosphatase
MKILHIPFIILILFGIMNSQPTQAQVKIGIFADCQYCDCETAGQRYYRNSLSKLNDCVSTFNKTENLQFVVGLGDLIDRDFSSFEKVNKVLNQSQNEVFHVTGNHDLSVQTENIDKVPSQLNLDKTYYSFDKENWRFIFLNGNEITLQSTNPEIVKQAKAILKQLKSDNKPNNKDWNGGMSTEQISWLKQELKNAEQQNKKVILFCHYPLLPFEAHALWNAEEVLQILQESGLVKAWINGHNHAGNYAIKNGIHFITMQGMVDTESKNAFSILTLSNNKIEIEGFGREISRSLPIK